MGEARTIGRIFTDLADEDPNRPSVTCDGSTASRLDLERRANRLARAYAELGVKAGDFVTIGLPNSIEFYEATVATWKLGAVPQPVSARLPARERQAIVDLAGPAIVVGADEVDHPGRVRASRLRSRLLTRRRAAAGGGVSVVEGTDLGRQHGTAEADRRRSRGQVRSRPPRDGVSHGAQRLPPGAGAALPQRGRSASRRSACSWVTTSSC